VRGYLNKNLTKVYLSNNLLILGEIIETKSTITVDYEFVRELD